MCEISPGSRIFVCGGCGRMVVGQWANYCIPNLTCYCTPGSVWQLTEVTCKPPVDASPETSTMKAPKPRGE